MKSLSFRTILLLGACLAQGGAYSRADTPGASSKPPEHEASAPGALKEQGPDSALQRAMELERGHKWTAAIEQYEGAIERWPDRSEFRHRLRLCEIHYRIGRRYQDRSFRNVLLRLPREKALDLFDELLERIETHYVEHVAYEPLLRRGLDNLEVALRDSSFLGTNGVTVEPSRVVRLREALRVQRLELAVRDRTEARRRVVLACEQARQSINLGAAPVIMEFIYGACDALPDDYSGYLTPDKLEELYSVIDGNFVGLGVELKQDEKGLRLVGVIAGGPAADAGLRSGEHITRIAGRSIVGQGLDEAAGRLQGAEGSAVRISVLGSDGKSRDLELIRRPVEVKSIVQSRIIEPIGGIGYVQMTGFQKGSTDEIDRAIRSLQRQGLRYLVLDLRGNPGGLLNVAVDIADQFLDQGIIVSTRGRAQGQSAVYRARPQSPFRMPMAILIDRDSASASEILAGALKENRRAVVIGERSYGKGSVQSIYNLRSAPTGLKLTTAKFYSPTNRPYSEQGVEPDLAVSQSAKPPKGTDAPPTIEFGNPARDPVLDTAIRHAKRKTLANAG